MIFLLALLPATVLVVAGYVAMFLSIRSEGRMRAFGHYLGVWAFTLAGLVVLGALFAAATLGPRMMYRGGPDFGPGFGGPGYMMQGGRGFGGPGFFMRRFDRAAPQPGGPGPAAPGGPGPGRGGNVAPAPAPNAAPAPGPA